MPLNPQKLQQDIKQLVKDMRERTEESADEEYAQRLALIIDQYIKSATITVAGITTAGSPTSQTQTAPVNAIIS